MATFTIRHEIDCTPEKFWELFFDLELQKKIFSELQFPKWEVVEQKETDTEIVRIVDAIPKFDAPAAVTKALGSSFGYREEGRFDKASKVYRFVVKPSVMADKLRNEGTVRCEPSGPDKCIRIVEVTAEAKIFGIGGMIEKMYEKGTREGWEKGAQLTNARLKGGG